VISLFFSQLFVPLETTKQCFRFARSRCLLHSFLPPLWLVWVCIYIPHVTDPCFYFCSDTRQWTSPHVVLFAPFSSFCSFSHFTLHVSFFPLFPPPPPPFSSCFIKRSNSKSGGVLLSSFSIPPALCDLTLGKIHAHPAPHTAAV